MVFKEVGALHGSFTAFLFSKLNKLFFGCFDPENIFWIMKMDNFQGELTDISAKKEAMLLYKCADDAISKPECFHVHSHDCNTYRV